MAQITVTDAVPPAHAPAPWDWVRGCALLLGFLALGEIAAPIAARIVPLPGAVIGLALLWGALRLGWVRAAHIADAARGLLVLMPLLFVPAGVGAFAGDALHGANGLRYALALLVLTPLTLGAVGWGAQRWLERGRPDVR